MSPIDLARKIVRDQRFRFLLVGGFNFLFGFAVFLAVNATVGLAIDRAGQPVVASIADVLISHVISSITAFALYRIFVFRVKGKLLIDFLRFQSVNLINLVANTVLLPTLVAAGLPRIPTQAGLVLVLTVVSYLGHRYFSFRRVPAAADEADAANSDPTPRH
ncbi:GtrA family protein [Gryllotalpicola sp.]|uniref:GtrA family protein n=1 Tax=Gryllotalpicola sp. TaxID=1932787 RepID=UPI002630DD88|nr:GtrA family protein [Gryllotalpicola sp.]